MELCTVQSPSKFSNHQTCSPSLDKTKQPNLVFKPYLYFSLRQPLIARTTCRLRSRVDCFDSRLPKTNASEESLDEVYKYGDEKRDSVITLENTRPTEKDDLVYDGVASEVKTEEKEDFSKGNASQQLEFLEKLNVELGPDDSGAVLLVGAGGLVALWLASAVVGSIESIPLVPKLMEVIGLSYTLWFSSRYLIFKKNRDELASKIQEIKSQVLGSNEA